jgi:periplasmic divalent cation tolerance protein
MYVAWTTVATQVDAETLSKTIISLGVAACVQIEGPIVSHYRWKGQLERSEEYRLTMKCMANQLGALKSHVLAHHSYEIPEWIVVRAEQVGEKYLSWVESNSTNPPL